jgi:ribosomal protein L18E
MGLAFLVATDGVAEERERMAMRRSQTTITILSVLLLFLGGSVDPARSEGLTDAEFTGYLAWLESIVSPAPADSGLAEPQRLYPFDLAGDDGAGFAAAAPHNADGEPGEGGQEAAAADVLIVTGRSLIDLEHELRRPSARRGVSAHEALLAARQYRHAAEYDSALAWYRRADARDTRRELRAQIALETIATAVALGDSAVVARSVLASLAGYPGEVETVIALRYLIAHRDEVNLGRVVAAVAQREIQDPALEVWLAYAHSTLGDWPACLDGLRALLARGGPDAEMSAPLRAWVLVAVPDMLFLAGDHEGAGALYRALAASEIPGVVPWARLQVASLDLLGGRHAAASSAFATLCADEAAAPWRVFACEMAKHSENLTRFGVEAKADGTANDDDH